MLLEKIAKRFLPIKFYGYCKNKYRHLKEKYHRRLSLDAFSDILRNELHITKGSVVFIHSSIYNLFLGFEPEKVLDILLEIVGEEGTLVFPSNQLQERAEDYLNRDKIFDVKKTLTRMGLLPGIAMFHNNSVRSLHPTNACLAIGKYANELLNEHHESIYPCGEKSPYYKIMKYKGIIVGLGVSTESLTFVHVVEDVMKEEFPVQTRLKRVFEGQVRGYDGKIIVVKTLAAHNNTGLRDVSGYFKKYIPDYIGRDFKINGISFFKIDASGLFEKMMTLAEDNITIYSRDAYLIKE